LNRLKVFVWVDVAGTEHRGEESKHNEDEVENVQMKIERRRRR
jgi:hypothetical protein